MNLEYDKMTNRIIADQLQALISASNDIINGNAMCDSIIGQSRVRSD